jgi:actinin alpha
MFIVHTMEEIQGLLDAHEQFKATLGEADKEYQSIVGLVQQVESIASQHSIPGGLDNPYTSLTAKVKEQKHYTCCVVLNRGDNMGLDEITIF